MPESTEAAHPSLERPLVDEMIPPALAPLACGATPAFGRVFTPGMLVAEWSEEEGWHGARIVPQGEIEIHPAAVVFHYGQAIFEGMKAHRQPNGALALFRAKDHGARFARSANRMAMPPMPAPLFEALVARFVSHQSAALPDYDGMSLYLRPLMIGNEAGLGIRASKSFLVVVLGSPVAPYFQGTARDGLRVEVNEDYVRAAAGGTGAVKAAGNYGRGLLGLGNAKRNGCDQVIWLDAHERAFVEEMEGMNFMCVREGALVSPPTSDTILPGVTRDSLLRLARDNGIPAREEPVRIDALLAGIERGQVTEAFAAGTAAVVAPIAEIVRRGASTPLAPEHPIATRLHALLTSHQRGLVPDRYGWLTPVEPARG